MVTKKELADFKETLTSSLRKAGYTAYGRIPTSEVTYSVYGQLPEQEMVTAYVEDNNLDEINKVYRVIKFISDNSGNYYSLKNLCKEQGTDYKVFIHTVENLPYIEKTGDRRKTQYNWIHQEEPSFSTAKDIVDHMRKLKSTKLSKTLKRKISQAVAGGVSKDDFFKAGNIRKEATYSADAYWNYQKVQQQNKNEEAPSESFAESTPEPVSASIISETALQDPGNGIEESAFKNEETSAAQEVVDEGSLQMEVYILRQEIKYLKKINKAKDKLIKALRKKE